MLLKEWVAGLSPWSKPDSVVALEHGSRLSGHQDLYSFSRTNCRDLDDLGLANVLYFTFLKRLVYLFVLASVLVALPLYVYFHGDFFRDEFLLRMSLANFGPLYDGMAEGEEDIGSLQDLATLDYSTMSVRVIKIPGIGVSVRATDLMLYLAAIDVGVAWLVFLVTYFLGVSNARKAEKHARERTTIGKYSVKVASVPKDSSKWELVEYFDNYGVVVDMSLALPDEEIIVLSRKRDACLAKLERCVAKVQQARGDDPDNHFRARALKTHIKRAFFLKEKIHKLSVRIKHLQVTRADGEPTCGFITYRDEGERLACLGSHGLRYNLSTIFDRKYCFKGKHAIRVGVAPEPDDLLRENLQYSWYSRQFRIFVVACLMFFLVLVSYLVNVGHASASHTLSVRDMKCPVVEEACPQAADLTPDGLDDLLEVIATEGEDSLCLDCLCHFALNQTSVVSFKKHCTKFQTAYLIQTVAPYTGALIVTLANTLIKNALVFLVQYEKHHTMRDLERHLFLGIFVVQFLNTFVSIVIANMKTPGVSDMIFPKTDVSEYMFQGKYVFLFPRWYEEVGSKLVSVVFVNRLMYARGVLWENAKRRLRRLRGGRGGALPQHDLNSLHEGPDFVPDAVRLGEMASLSFITVFFSSGLPLLYPLLALVLWVQFWVDKYQLLRVCRTPDQGQGARTLTPTVAGVLPYCAILHCGFAVVAFALYPMERSALADDAYVGPYLVRVVSALQNLLDDGAREEAKYVKVVLLQRHTVLFVASILLMAAFLAVGATWRLWRLLIGKAFGLVCGAGGGGEYEDDGGDDLDASSDNFVASGAAGGSRPSTWRSPRAPSRVSSRTRPNPIQSTTGPSGRWPGCTSFRGAPPPLRGRKWRRRGLWAMTRTMRMGRRMSTSMRTWRWTSSGIWVGVSPVLLRVCPFVV